jgi:hypothetical protein
MKKNTSLALVIALLGFCGIAACAKSPPSQFSRATESNQAEIEAEKAAAVSDAAARASAPGGSDVENPGIEDENRLAKPEGSPIPSAVLEDRIVKLIDSLRAPSDMARAHLEQVMQIKLSQDSAIREWLMYAGDTREGWRYSILFKESGDGDLPSIGIGFSSSESENTGSAVCSYELEAFSQRLTALGYSRLPGWRQPQAHAGFEREIEGARFGSSIHVFKYVWKKEVDGNPLYCIEGINIYAGMRDNGE